ncbi:4Fe-4S binding protein [Anaerobacterium chartisolvens]|uniref:4Fe-4S binding protein n=1 Tax=Anaerobacterium chartisolvens TaxID=1297424 RepID=A0A369BF61_9FIRM|nr:4Fe-4S binding protein [Anaerobacterium chartisolvens]RCX20180.1 4Fe-4S binding protein [Anaerobacterium chartisolvens]
MKKLYVILIAASLMLIISGVIRNEMEFVYETNTYGNFDVPGTQSWIMKLEPGVEDYASEIVYGTMHYKPLAVISALFVLTLFLSLIKLRREFILRKFLQWTAFATARIGVLRVSGLYPVKRSQLCVFPFLNCQACEMATGACPIGMLQWCLIKGDGLLLVIGIMLLAGAAAGRAICGWLCPFGFIADLFDRISLKKIRVPKIFKYLKYILFISIPLVIIFKMPFFCSFLCQSGNIYGRFPYYLTTGMPGLKAEFLGAEGIKPLLVFQLISLLALVAGAILIGGRWFCRYVCPLGAWLGLGNYVSPVRVLHDNSKCTNCGVCSKICAMDADLAKAGFNDVTSCIRCGKCTRICKARHFEISWKIHKGQAPKETSKEEYAGRV